MLDIKQRSKTFFYNNLQCISTLYIKLHFYLVNLAFILYSDLSLFQFVLFSCVFLKKLWVDHCNLLKALIYSSFSRSHSFSTIIAKIPVFQLVTRKTSDFANIWPFNMYVGMYYNTSTNNANCWNKQHALVLHKIWIFFSCSIYIFSYWQRKETEIKHFFV